MVVLNLTHPFINAYFLTYIVVVERWVHVAKCILNKRSIWRDRVPLKGLIHIPIHRIVHILRKHPTTENVPENIIHVSGFLQ